MLTAAKCSDYVIFRETFVSDNGKKKLMTLIILSNYYMV